MRVLIVGSGGREHALAWSLSRSNKVQHVYVAPGNAGSDSAINGLLSCSNIAMSNDDLQGLLDFARDEHIDLTIVGPEVPLALGIVDLFRENGLRIFGPDKFAAQLEASKAFSKQFMQSHNIPTANAAIFTDATAAKRYATERSPQLVVKADGLAAGKGVIVCNTHAEINHAIDLMLTENAFGDAGKTIILEDCLTGREISVLAFCDGKTLEVMPIARDHKRIFDGDQGGNTGGMGAICPTPDVDHATIQEVVERVILPALRGMAQVGHPYIGVLYAGIMLTEHGIQTLEFNCRFGDPETQVILPLLETDLLDVFNACVDGKLAELPLQWSNDVCATVVMASQGYPNSYSRHIPIHGLEEATQVKNGIVFHAGTMAQDNQIVTNGGRVLAATGVGTTLDEALAIAYQLVETIHFEGAHYRRDIGRTFLQETP